MKHSSFLAIFLTIVLTGFSSLAFAQNGKDTTETDQVQVVTSKNGYPVVVQSDTLLRIYTSSGDISVRQRAKVLSESLENARSNFVPGEDSIKSSWIDGKHGEIRFRDELLLSLSQAEANAHDKSLDELTLQTKEAIEANFQKNISQKETFIQYAMSIGILFLFIFILNYLLKLVFRRVNAFIDKRKGKYLKGIKVKEFEILDAEDELELAYKITSIVRILLLLLLAYVTFPVIFSLFPATEPIAYKLFGYVYNPLISMGRSFLAYIPKLFTIIVIVFVFRTILKYMRLFARRVELGRIRIHGFYPDWANTTFSLIRILIIALGIVMVFPYLPGAQSEVFKGVSVFIGIIFSIGSTSVVGNLVAGLVLTYMRPFKIGDRIKIGDVEGEIVEKTFFVIRIKTPKNEYITLPNANVLNAHIVNYNRSFDDGGVILFTEVTIGYDVPWRKVHDLLLRAAVETEYIEEKPEPFVLQKRLDDYSVAYQINGYSKRPLYKDLVNSLLHQQIQDIFAEAGVEILSPKYVASRDGNDSTIPNNDPPDKPKSTPDQPDKPDRPEKPSQS